MHNQDSSRDLVGKARAVVAMHPDEDSLSDEFHGLVIFRRGHGCSGGVGPPGRLPFRRDLEAVTRRVFFCEPSSKLPGGALLRFPNSLQRPTSHRWQWSYGPLDWMCSARSSF